MGYVRTGEASKLLGIHPNTVRAWADAGKLDFVRSPGGQRLYDVSGFINKNKSIETVLYARVSTRKQKEDLKRQIEILQERYPDGEIISDIGSGLNFKRKGFKALLERLGKGDKLRVVVTWRDRLARFGVEIVEQLLLQHGGELVVLNKVGTSPHSELVRDIISIITVFSARVHGLRSHCNKIKKDTTLPEWRAGEAPGKVGGRV